MMKEWERDRQTDRQTRQVEENAATRCGGKEVKAERKRDTVCKDPGRWKAWGTQH